MSCPDPYRPYNPFEDAPTSDADLTLQSALPSDAEIRGLKSALAANGGGDASEDLALDLVLNQIVEQACLATGATGAAIALTRDGEMVCRATTGRTAPDLGVRLDNAGFSAECLRIGTLQRCDDTETDPRVDASACRLLGVRSILVVPLWYWGEFMGIFEIFSPRPNAFGERDEQTLQALAYGIVRHTKQSGGQITGFAAKPEDVAAPRAPTPVVKVEAQRVEPMPPPMPEPVRERMRTPVFELKPRPASKPSGSDDRWTSWLAVCAGIIACLIVGLMAWRLGGNRGPAQKASSEVQAAPQAQELDLAPVTASAAPAAPEQSKPAPPNSSSNRTAASSSHSDSTASDLVISAASKSASKVPVSQGPSAGNAQPSGDTGGLAIYDEKGKLIYGKPIHPEQNPTPAKAPAKPRASANPPAPGSEMPSAARGSASATAASSVRSAALRSKLPQAADPSLADDHFVRLKPELAESLLAQRIEPDYPEAARRAHIQGTVVLETLIGANGRVQQVSAVSGNPDLAEAAMAAVRQWRYKPFTVDGKKVPIRTQVNVQFLQAQ